MNAQSISTDMEFRQSQVNDYYEALEKREARDRLTIRPTRKFLWLDKPDDSPPAPPVSPTSN